MLYYPTFNVTPKNEDFLQELINVCLTSNLILGEDLNSTQNQGKTGLMLAARYS